MEKRIHTALVWKILGKTVPDNFAVRFVGMANKGFVFVSQIRRSFSNFQKVADTRGRPTGKMVNMLFLREKIAIHPKLVEVVSQYGKRFWCTTLRKSLKKVRALSRPTVAAYAN